jgi:hypothetical protein
MLDSGLPRISAGGLPLASVVGCLASPLHAPVPTSLPSSPKLKRKRYQIDTNFLGTNYNMSSSSLLSTSRATSATQSSSRGSDRSGLEGVVSSFICKYAGLGSQKMSRPNTARKMTSSHIFIIHGGRRRKLEKVRNRPCLLHVLWLPLVL